VEEALAAWRTMRTRGDVIELLGGGEVRYEVPFSFMEPGSARLLRGTIDCLVRRPDGRVTIVEFKTGRPRPVHERQLNIYLEAARRLFPHASIDGRLIYP